MTRTLTLETVKKIGEKVLIQGWVKVKRDHGAVAFVDIRDRSGVVQVVGSKEQFKELKAESVVEVLGEVVERSESTKNTDLATGDVEIKAEIVTILNHAETLPFPIDTLGGEIEESLRLKHRYLDLRRPRLQKNIRNRSAFVQSAREFLFNEGFCEIETPLLTQSTQEGSRDFLVPSRLQPGKFFALPQSPQQYKQLLMTAGFERYFQIARCIRDEDPRADRGFEHTQIDIELSFVKREDVMALDEQMITHVIEKMGGKIAKKPFPVFTYKEAIETFGADKFDMRTQKEKEQGLLVFAWVVDFPFFKKVDTEDAAEVADGKSGWTFTHNPFSQPKDEHLAWHLAGEHIDEILTTQYDLVCNGYEVGGGSIRAHDPKTLKATYQIMGYTDEEIESRVGHMLEAFKYGCPPHGGLAHGVERLLMILEHEEYLREVQAFPQTGRGRISVMQAPGDVSEKQLAELGLKTIASDKKVSVYNRILDVLQNRSMSYMHYAHKEVFTSEEAAQVRGDVSLHMGAKALILNADGKHILLVVPGDQKADLATLKTHLGSKKIEFAKKEWVETNIGLPFGSIPPFGSMMGLATYVDKRLDQAEIVFNAGKLDRSIKMSYKDFLEIEQPTLI